MDGKILLVVTAPNEQGSGSNSQVVPFRDVPRMGDLVRIGRQMWSITRVIWSPLGNEWDATAEIVLSPLAAPEVAPEDDEDDEDEDDEDVEDIPRKVTRKKPRGKRVN